jgi:hypothetical protein
MTIERPEHRVNHCVASEFGVAIQERQRLLADVFELADDFRNAQTSCRDQRAGRSVLGVPIGDDPNHISVDRLSVALRRRSSWEARNDSGVKGTLHHHDVLCGLGD